PCVLISFSTSSSELEAQKWFRKRAEWRLTRQLVKDFTKIRYQLTSDIRIRITKRVLPIMSLCATKCRMPPSASCCTVVSSRGGALVAAVVAASVIDGAAGAADVAASMAEGAAVAAEFAASFRDEATG